MVKKSVLRILLVFVSSSFFTNTLAELRIEITQGLDNATKIAIVPFVWKGKRMPPVKIDEIVSADLTISGRFEAIDQAQMLSYPEEESQVFVRDWRMLGVEYLVFGRIEPDGVMVKLNFEMFDIAKGTTVLSQSILGLPNELRDMAHYVSDQVYKEVTGTEGAFSTEIMYVTVEENADSRLFSLNIADSDGRNVRQILESDEPLLSATWSPDGRFVSYVSFEREGRPAIYLHELKSNNRQVLTSFSGLNGAPAFSPDGKKIALVLSKDGNPDIYIMELQSRKLRRVTRHYGIDTEPSWSADGESIIFTSNRGGQPQIYQLRLEDFQIQRLTFEGDYNAKASLLRDGSALVMVHRREGVFHIAMLDLRNGRLNVLTETSLDESPSVAPNGSLVIYATQYRGEGILATVSVDGLLKFRLPSSSGDVREPAWSPKTKKSFNPLD
ncbi:MAG: Tol-Pal system beta propeller repeat protein TolB [Gammaproteobacteria bacterium]|nr:Tol-Pal system beta propeller repeat protein TolB [Gammaproteobacteria bacterium]